jgi:hypothetical protein
MPTLPTIDKKTPPPLPGLPGSAPGGGFSRPTATAKKTVVFANDDDDDDAFPVVSKPKMDGQYKPPTKPASNLP